jgi:hypothetical protein
MANATPLHQIPNWCVHQNAVIVHTEELINNNLYCFTEWSNRHWCFILMLFAYKQKSLGLYSPPPLSFLLWIYCQLKTWGEVPRSISVWKKRFHGRKSTALVWYVYSPLNNTMPTATQPNTTVFRSHITIHRRLLSPSVHIMYLRAYGRHYKNHAPSAFTIGAHYLDEKYSAQSGEDFECIYPTAAKSMWNVIVSPYVDDLTKHTRGDVNSF